MLWLGGMLKCVNAWVWILMGMACRDLVYSLGFLALWEFGWALVKVLHWNDSGFR